MSKNEFLFVLKEASIAAIEFAKNYLTHTLSSEVNYEIELNTSFDVGLEEKFDTYPEEDRLMKYNLSSLEVADILYRNSKTPVWIDISVFKSTSTTTTLKLNCAGRYTDDEKEHYYRDTGLGPFGIKSPVFPAGWKEGETFSLR